MKRHPADPAIESRRKVPPPADTDPAIEALVQDIIAKVADKWTMLILEVLEEHGTLRFTQIGRLVGNISQKMLTKTLRQMESDGLVRRTVDPADRRRAIVDLTEEALAFARRIHDLRRRQMRAALAQLDPEERPVFVKSLRALVAALEKTEGGEPV